MSGNGLAGLIGLIVGIVGSLLAYIFKLRSDKQGLQNKVSELQANSDLTTDLKAVEDSRHDSDQAERDYRNAVDEYLKRRNRSDE